MKKLLQFVKFIKIYLCWTSFSEPETHRVAASTSALAPQK
jgi:hypothetical protein